MSRLDEPTNPHEMPALARALERNIDALVARRAREEREASIGERLAEGITRFAGSMPFVYLHLALFGAWIAINSGWIPSVPRWDPTLVVLAMLASVEAIFLSTFVLISQNRMAADDARRADLDLQISLLNEHETTRLMKLVSAIAEKLGLESELDAEVEELEEDVAPEAVLDRLEERENGADAVEPGSKEPRARG